jgi:hypothetical protein
LAPAAEEVAAEPVSVLALEVEVEEEVAAVAELV